PGERTLTPAGPDDEHLHATESMPTSRRRRSGRKPDACVRRCARARTAARAEAVATPRTARGDTPGVLPAARGTGGRLRPVRARVVRARHTLDAAPLSEARARARAPAPSRPVRQEPAARPR